MLILKVRGMSRLEQNIKKLQQQYPKRVANAMLAEARVELKEARRRTPVDTGELRASGFVAQTITRSKIETEIGFDTPYAIFVHEDLEANHPRGGQAKFLESVLRESAPHMADRLARRLRL